MKIDIIRAWKDEAYRQSLTSEQQALLPENPAGELELSESELETIHGANGGFFLNTFSVTACTQSAAGLCFTFGVACFNS